VTDRPVRWNAGSSIQLLLDVIRTEWIGYHYIGNGRILPSCFAGFCGGSSTELFRRGMVSVKIGCYGSVVAGLDAIKLICYETC